tara:strand:+ start:519 stop:674 length:156 start_codon:yes stop_codon:yes gene_type:complete
MSGGLNEGLAKDEYHGSLKLNIIIELIIEGKKVIIRKKIKDKDLFCVILIL